MKKIFSELSLGLFTLGGQVERVVSQLPKHKENEKKCKSCKHLDRCLGTWISEGSNRRRVTPKTIACEKHERRKR